jgi:hypothetical protein
MNKESLVTAGLVLAGLVVVLTIHDYLPNGFHFTKKA